MKNTIAQFLQQDKIAVVGASNDQTKYGNIVFRKLENEGYKVFPVNPSTPLVEGHTCYPTLKDIPEKVDALMLVVPPTVTEEVVKEALAMQVSNIWMQPGAESQQAINQCAEKQVGCVYGKCILVELNNK